MNHQHPVIASAAARVNIIGEHSDYNGGEVLPMAIGRRTVVQVRALASAERSRVASATQKTVGTFDVRAIESQGAWWDYISGVAREMRRLGIDVPQLDIQVTSDVPSGAGLSSSAAIEVAAAAAINALTGAGVADHELAKIAWRVETQFVGVACGIMDQFASALGTSGHALHIWCDTEETEQVPMSETVLIFDTATPRSLRSSQFNQRRAECEQAFAALHQRFPELPHLAAATLAQLDAVEMSDVPRRRARHVITEQQRVRDTVAALKRGDPIDGPLLYASHESLRTLFECSSPELDWFVDRMASTDGVRGARLTGAGWGGCAIAIGDIDALRTLDPALSDDYARAFGRRPRVWISTAADGVRVGS